MTIRCAALLTLIGTLVPAQAQELHLWAEELKPVFTVLQKAHLAGWMELSGRCDPTHLPGFPQFKDANAQESSFLKALREVAMGDPAMRVKQDEVGTIWMQEKGVPHDVLKIRIARVVFEDYGHNDVYSANAALEAVLRTPEVITYAKMHNLAVSPSPTETRGITGPAGRPHWPPGSPHLSGSIYNVTVLEALDQIQRTFPGEMLVYWNCPETQNKNEPKRTTNPHKQDEDAGPSSNCLRSYAGEAQFAVFPPGVPNPFCLSQSALPGLPQLFPTLPEPSHQRRAFFHFFSMKKGYGGKMLVVSG